REVGGAVAVMVADGGHAGTEAGRAVGGDVLEAEIAGAIEGERRQAGCRPRAAAQDEGDRLVAVGEADVVVVVERIFGRTETDHVGAERAAGDRTGLPDQVAGRSRRIAFVELDGSELTAEQDQRGAVAAARARGADDEVAGAIAVEVGGAQAGTDRAAVEDRARWCDRDDSVGGAAVDRAE